MLNDVTQLEQEIKALEKEKEYFKDWCKVYESRIETKDHIINQLETNIKDAIELIFNMNWNEWGNGAEFKIKEILERGKE